MTIKAIFWLVSNVRVCNGNRQKKGKVGWFLKDDIHSNFNQVVSAQKYQNIWFRMFNRFWTHLNILPALSSFTFLLSNFVELYLNSKKRADKLILNPCLHTFNFLQHIELITLKESHLTIIFQTNMWPIINFVIIFPYFLCYFDLY